MRLDELTRNDILKDVQSKVKKRSDSLELPTYIGITKDYTVKMKVKSATGSSSYVVSIKLVEYPSIADEVDLTTREKVRLSLAGDIAISCTCPAFRYWGYEYIMTQVTAHVGDPQNIYPKIRNPKLEGTLCKHAYKALKSFGRYWVKISSDIDKRRFIS